MSASRMIAAALRLGAAASALVLGAGVEGHEGVAALEVKVNLRTSASPISVCSARQTTEPPVASVVCLPSPAPEPVPITRKPYSNVRFYISGTGDWLGTIDESMGLGTVTSWRVVRLANRDYLEMMVGW